MLAKLMNLLKACWQPSSNKYAHAGSDVIGRKDGLLWYKDSGQHVYGEFSMAMVQANNLLEDQSQLETGPLSSVEFGPYGTFVGVYDGHGGPETSCYVNDHLFPHLKRFATEQQSMSADVIRKAYQATEDGFISLVTEQWPVKPQIAAVGSCCLVGVICGGMLYIANLGDSRAVLGRVVKATGEVLAVQLSAEHNVGIEPVRQELQSMHPDDRQIVVLKHNVWRVKGVIQGLVVFLRAKDSTQKGGLHEDLIALQGLAQPDIISVTGSILWVLTIDDNQGQQISRSIGDVYLKRTEFNREPLHVKFRLREPFKKPILSSEPSITVQPLQPQDQFLIFASDGLWEHLSNQKAVDIVQNNPPNGSARRLVKAALQEAAKKREMRYSDLKKIDRGVRRHFHDDITVIVVFLDSNLVSRASSLKGPSLSLRGGGVNVPANSLAPCTMPTQLGAS
ncbi:probable protein phosphatase 2C 60 isoform X1 [Musa acuminata AAA Group]|uniref:probable protein phosphatase 2C 60 isoform X1 n=1 Tax=Musa acuminata AAA Group TaxID=214697 RepID=UPI0031DBD8A5